MRTRRHWSLVLGFALPAMLTAQTTPKPTRTATSGSKVIVNHKVITRPALNSVCAELASSPSPLVRAPEGRALLRFRKDLEGAAVAMALRGDPLERVEVQRISEVRRGIDSLMQVFVRTVPGENGRAHTIVTMRRDSTGSGGGTSVHDARAAMESRVVRGQLEATIRSLEPQIAALMGSAVARAPMRIPMPTGWMGVTMSKSSRDVPSPDGMLTYNCEYPVIEAVHAGSPAEKGGLLAGDTLLAYNGHDVRADAVNLTTLLVPRRVVRVRVNRDGRLREVPITIAPRPDEPNMAFVRSLCAPGQRCEPRAFSIELDTMRGTRFEVSPRTGSFGAMGRPNVDRVWSNAPLMPAMPVDAMLRGTGLAVIAGAQLSVIDEEFAQTMGVEPGVLVIRVLPATPLSEAGIRAGEVIRAVNGVPLREMQALRSAFGTSGTREVRLTVSGKGTGPRIVVVKW